MKEGKELYIKGTPKDLEESIKNNNHDTGQENKRDS